jgi:amidase
MYDPFGAFFRRLDIMARGSSGGPLAGLTFGAKDLFDVMGNVTGAGNPDWLRTHGPATETACSIQVLLEAGARLVGKTITDELAFSLSGKNVHYGTPLNPAAPDRITGGSSSGSASAAAASLVDFALGTDTSGSIRIPASYCGLFAMRPTHGRISTLGVVPLAPSFDTVGWLARNAEVLYRVGEVLLGERSSPAPLRRLLIAEDAFALADPPLQDLLTTSLTSIRTHFQTVASIRLAQAPLQSWAKTELVLKDYEAWQTHGSWIEQVNPCFAPDIERRFQRASKVTLAQRAAAEPERIAIRTRLLELLQDDAVICLPTAPSIAPRRDTPGEALDEVRHRTLTLTCLAGLGGLPQIALPMVTYEGCPAGISLIGAPGQDMALLAFARMDEGTFPILRMPLKKPSSRLK